MNGTLNLILMLDADDLNSIRTWIDASYAVHPDMKIHTGGIISMGTDGQWYITQINQGETKY